jgi:hypothetical protein
MSSNRFFQQVLQESANSTAVLMQMANSLSSTGASNSTNTSNPTPRGSGIVFSGELLGLTIGLAAAFIAAGVLIKCCFRNYCRNEHDENEYQGFMLNRFN